MDELSKRQKAARQDVIESHAGKGEMARRVIEMQSRYDARIANQIDAINRLLVDGYYDNEMTALHKKLEDTAARLSRVQTALRHVLSIAKDQNLVWVGADDVKDALLDSESAAGGRKSED